MSFLGFLFAMSRLYVFADEAGDFDFSRNPNASRYFILCTVSMHSCHIANELIELRRKLAWEGHELGEYFHCTKDKQVVRDQVFDAICEHDFTAQATIMEKAKAYPHIREDRPRFYQYGWYYHFKHGTRKRIHRNTELMVTAAAIGNRKERAAFSSAVEDVINQTVRIPWRTDFCPAAADPCLQVADYCAWAIQRKWERDDSRSYELIADRVTYEYDLWSHGNTLFY